MAGKRGAGVLALVVVAAACGSSSRHALVVQPAAASPLSFREVTDTVPYHGACGDGRRLTPAARLTETEPAVLADAAKTACYVLGPVVWTAQHVGSADPVVNPVTAGWEVHVHFTTDDFVQKVASPKVGKQIAMVLDDVVEAAPTINPGITGNDVTIAGDWDEAGARAVAAKIDPTSASRPPTPPTTTEFDTIVKRCDGFHPPSAGTVSTTTSPADEVRTLTTSSTVSAANARDALTRAHLAIPQWLADTPAATRLARCDLYDGPDPRNPATSTTVCPNGLPAPLGGLVPDRMFALDAEGRSVELPGMQYLLPPGMTVPTAGDPCAGLGAP